MEVFIGIGCFFGTILLLSLFDATKEFFDPKFSKIKVGDLFSIDLSRFKPQYKINEHGLAQLIVVKIIGQNKYCPEILKFLFCSREYPKVVFFDIDNGIYVHCKLLSFNGAVWEIDNSSIWVKKITSCTGEVLWNYEKINLKHLSDASQSSYLKNEYLRYSFCNETIKKVI